MPPASETVAGVVEIATDAEVDAGLDPWRVITARTLKRALGALSGFALLGHKHDAADTTSGVFHVGRIPALDMSKITGLANALAGKAAEVHTHTINQITGLVDALAGKAATVHQHVADDIVSGVLAVGRIPALGMEKITGLATALASKAPLLTPQFTGIAWFGTDRLGKINIQGADDRAGVIEFHGPGGRLAFLGYGDGPSGNPYLGTDGARVWNFQSRPAFNGATPWDAANFDPNTRVSVAATNLGSTWNVPLTTLSSAAQFAALPTGFSSMITPHSVGTPGGYGYLFKMARRDSNDGWSGLWINHIAALGDAPELFVGTAIVGTALPTWTRAWTTANFNPVTKVDVFNPDGYPHTISMGWNGERMVARVDASVAHHLVHQGDAASAGAAIAGAAADLFITPAALWSFARSIGPNGYIQIPGTPIIMQWGVRAATVAEGPVDSYLPVAFGGGCLFASATPRNASGVVTMDFYMQVMGRWQDRISWYANRANGSAGNMSGFEWMAIGLATGNPDPAYYSGGGGGGGGGELNPEL